jgi:fermentation-respiration switch protein FrsA (DUF1100 family)
LGRIPLSRHISGKKENKKTKKVSSGKKAPKPTVFLLGFLLILVGVFGILYNPSTPNQTESWQVSEAGILSFSDRGQPVFTAQEIEDTYAPDNPDTLKLLSFESKEDKIQALLRIPANHTNSSAGVVLLPGAGITKEAKQGLAVELSKMGYATLTPDQRNLAGINPEKDLELFKAKLEPIEYTQVYDALKATDVLVAQPEINPDKLAILGESNGGRFAILACALNPALKGVIGISTSGYGTEKIDPASVKDPETYRFYRSIDPDTYLSTLPPAKFVLIHSFNDTVISHDLALRTFALAKEPKAMYNVSEATHGYTASMHPYLQKELVLLLN